MVLLNLLQDYSSSSDQASQTTGINLLTAFISTPTSGEGMTGALRFVLSMVALAIAEAVHFLLTFCRSWTSGGLPGEIYTAMPRSPRRLAFQPAYITAPPCRNRYVK